MKGGKNMRNIKLNEFEIEALNTAITLLNLHLNESTHLESRDFKLYIKELMERSKFISSLKSVSLKIYRA